MSEAQLATIPTANSNPRKRKAEHDHCNNLTGTDLVQGQLRQNAAAVEGGSSSMPAGAQAEALAGAAGSRQDAADEDTAHECLFPDDIQLWKAACLLARDPSLQELITILKVRPQSVSTA